MKPTILLKAAGYACAVALGSGFAAAAVAQSCSSGAEPGHSAPLVDHHTHILTPRSAHWADVQDASLEPRGMEDLLTAMRKDGVARAAVLSTAYWFDHSTPKTPRNYEDVKVENDNVGRLVAYNHDRLVAFFGINPLALTALDEIRRNVRTGRFAGVKLHLANSEADLRNPGDIEKLARVFALVDELRVPVVIHMRTRRKDYGYVDAENFIKKVLPKASHIPVQIAHLAGWGGYDANTDGALKAFVDNEKDIRADLYFDIAAIVKGENEEAPPSDEDKGAEKKDSVSLAWPDAHYAQLAADRIRQIGVARIVFGTDWPLSPPAEYWHDFSEQIPLDPCELSTIRSNRAPWLRTGD